MLKIRRALISVWEKRGIVDFAKRLKKFNVEIISTGKTASLLRKSGLKVKEVASLTAFPEILSGRVKTLHPKIFGGVLANKKNPLHTEEIRKLDIEPIDMVVVNFYPFEQMREEGLGIDRLVEYIDIGGPSILRAAAKNFKNVASVSNLEQYREIIEEIEANNGSMGDELLKKLACEVFRKTKEYDTTVYSYFKNRDLLNWNLEKVISLRYGENPHQRGALYKRAKGESLAFRQLQGKQLSFNNLLDLDTAFGLVGDFSQPAAVIVKHASVCGAATDKVLHKAYAQALRTDPLSSFGGIIGLNRKVDRKTAQTIAKSGFKECIVGPLYSKEALKIFSSLKNLRIIEVDLAERIKHRDVKRTCFGYLVQDEDVIDYDKSKLEVVTKRTPTEREWADLLFAWRVAKSTKSNAIVVAKNTATLGIGGGQPSRVGAAKMAIKNSPLSTKGAVLASDAFFPKDDSIKVAHKAQIKAIIQPGGSIKDSDIIKACDKYNIAMVFTRIRHLRH